MFRDEEEKLEKWKDEIEKKEVPDIRLEQAIKDGFGRAKNVQSKNKRRYYKRSVWSVVVAAILLLTFVTSIRVSPAFASMIASLPGMEKIVDLIQDDKGISSVVANEYYQELNNSSEIDGVTFTLLGAIADEQEMTIFYSIANTEGEERFRLASLDVLDGEGNRVARDTSTIPGSDFTSKGNNIEQTARTNLKFEKGVTVNEFVLKVTLQADKRSIDYEIPFTLAKEKMPTIRYPINETVSIEGQNITIKQIEISPIKVNVHIGLDPANTKKIFRFEDLRLVDDKGETWAIITNGIASSGSLDDDEVIYHLESNYFEQVDGLSLVFNKLMALDKVEAHLLIDTDKRVILEQPADQRYSVLQMKKGYFEFLLKAEKGYHTGPFNSFIDAEGKEINFTSGGFSRSEDETVEITASFPYESFVNPIKLPLYGYPQWIEGDVKIKIK
ncbi:DUF5643 domain-containing protein [Sporosarcina limicola]|uniref:DUF4179 domain-containing protein n=1 Tax=Sporosarcina limicola TaxID=34101 RepID=A0A927R7Z4_9BACL|nr:hypothetical protein [Sporosarcina limicola]